MTLNLKIPCCSLNFFQHTIDLGLEFGLVEGDAVTLDSTKIRLMLMILKLYQLSNWNIFWI